MLLGTRRCHVGSDGGSGSRMLLGTRRCQVGSDGGFSIGHAARNGKYKTKGTLVVVVAGVRALDPRGAKFLPSTESCKKSLGFWIFCFSIFGILNF